MQSQLEAALLGHSTLNHDDYENSCQEDETEDTEDFDEVLLFFKLLPTCMHVLSLFLFFFLVLKVILLTSNCAFRKMRWTIIKIRVSKYFVARKRLVIDQ